MKIYLTSNIYKRYAYLIKDNFKFNKKNLGLSKKKF